MPSYLTPEARTLRFSHLSFPSAACCKQHVHTRFMSAALTMQLPLPAVCVPPMYLGPHSGHCVVRPEYKWFWVLWSRVGYSSIAGGQDRTLRVGQVRQDGVDERGALRRAALR